MEINSDGIIRADIMTARIEDKNLLTKKGDIYVGTGATTSYDGTDVYQTKAMNIQAAITEDVQREDGSHSLNLGAGTFNGVNAISLGYNANVSADGAISLGYNANVSAANAVQIGTGTNNVANSLQFRYKTVVNGNGEIAGDYPLGFTKRLTSVLDDGWPKNHSDLTDGTIVTDWCYDVGGNANIAFVRTYDSTAQTSDLNLVVDGNIYVEEGLRRVYAEGDKVGSAVTADNADKLNNIVLTSVDQIINKDDGSIKINGCVSFVMFERGVVLDSEHTIPANSKGIIVGTATSDLAIIYTAYGTSGCLFYNATGKDWRWAFPEKATNATNAENATNATNATYAYSADNATNATKTSFTNTPWKVALPQDIKLTEYGTYQFIHNRMNLGLIYWDGNITVNGTLGVLYEGTASSVEDGDTYFIRITSGGLVELYQNASSGPVKVTTTVAVKYRKIS